MKKKLNQSGFGAVEIILILVIIIGLGAGGYYVWHRNHKSYSPTSSNLTPTSQNNKYTANPPSTTVRNTTLGNAPQGLQTAVYNHFKSTGCVLPNGNLSGGMGDTTGVALTDIPIYYLANRAARVKNICGGFAYFSDSDGAWNFDVGGQMGLPCSTYLKYEIPAALVAAGTNSSTAVCVNASGTGTDTYTSN